jgi:thiol-disulfide isomerase/thioredoxin
VIFPLLRRISGLLASVLLLVGCTLGVAENDPGGGAISIATVPLIEPADRQPGPDACGETLQGEALCVADLAGSPTLVNFWASWCGPCAREVPELVDIAAAYDGRVDLVGVNIEDTIVNATSFERDQQVTYPSLFDRGALIAAQFGGIAPEALPSTILLDAEGRVAVRLFGAVSAATLRPYLDALLTEAPGGA